MKSLPLIAGIGALVIITGAGFFFFGSDMPLSKSSQNSTEQKMNSQDTEAGTFSGSLKALGERGGEWKCMVDAQAQTGAGSTLSSGTVYVSGNHVRADFETTVQGFGNVTAHLIADNEFTYSWTSAYPQGVKTKITAEGQSQNTETSGQGTDANQSYTYTCEPASVDTSYFTVPADINFMSI